MKVNAACVRSLSPGPRPLQSHRILEAARAARIATSFRPDKRSGALFHGVSSINFKHGKDVLIFFRAICVAAFSVAENEIITSSLVLSNILNALGSPTLLCVLGSRMFFNLKEAAEHGVNVGTNWSSYAHSTVQSIRFDKPRNGEAEYV